MWIAKRMEKGELLFLRHQSQAASNGIMQRIRKLCFDKAYTAASDLTCCRPRACCHMHPALKIPPWKEESAVIACATEGLLRSPKRAAYSSKLLSMNTTSSTAYRLDRRGASKTVPATTCTSGPSYSSAITSRYCNPPFVVALTNLEDASQPQPMATSEFINTDNRSLPLGFSPLGGHTPGSVCHKYFVSSLSSASFHVLSTS
mmetsp:Transcript_119468/g.217117  ORF Transcript_119468/g.217117 Transcript_119468/m.217117 type:complete len:203 (+) Transcript_119468:729-1337(+)